MLLAVTIIFRYAEARKHWWFIDPAYLAFPAFVGIVGVIVWTGILAFRWIRNRKLQCPAKFVAWVIVTVAVVALMSVMEHIQGPRPMD